MDHAANMMKNDIDSLRGLPAFIDQFLRAAPMRAEVLDRLGLRFLKVGRPDLGAIFFSHAVERAPDFCDANYNLGRTQLALGKFESAREHFERVLAADPLHSDAESLLGHALRSVGLDDEGVSHYKAVILRDPDNITAHWGLATHHLENGRWKQGWSEFEWRFRLSDKAAARLNPPIRGAVRWTGQSLRGKSILLRAEEGLGDTIQFCRFAPVLSEMGARVFLSVQQPLVGLLGSLHGVADVCQLGKEQRFTGADYWSPLQSVPLWLNATEEDFSRDSPYLFPTANSVQRWASRIKSVGNGYRVGLVWAGNPVHLQDYARSMSLKDFARLADASCTFFSLQCGKREFEAKEAPLGLRLIRISGELKDFSETAGAIANLDLVITVDTSVAHLAGALGRPVWTLIPFYSDWRWLRDRNDSPWYPTMRLYRQKVRGDWRDVLDSVAKDLKQLSRAK